MLSSDEQTIRWQCLKLVVKAYGATDPALVLAIAMQFSAFVTDLHLPPEALGADDAEDTDPPADGEVLGGSEFVGEMTQLGRARA